MFRSPDVPGEPGSVPGRAQESAAIRDSAGDLMTVEEPCRAVAIGKIAAASGSVTILHADGTILQATVGDAVYEGDVVQAGLSAVSIAFVDSTVINLAAGGRMALSEFAYDPNSASNSALINVVDGTFAYLGGKVARTGELRLATPFATIRRTASNGGIGMLALGALTLYGLRESDATSGDTVTDDGLIPPQDDKPHGIYDLIFPDGHVMVVEDIEHEIVVTPTGSGQYSVQMAAISPSQAAEWAQQLNQLHDVQLNFQTLQGTQGGSSANPFSNDLPSGLHFDLTPNLTPINFQSVLPPSGGQSSTTGNSIIVVPTLEAPAPQPPTVTITTTTLTIISPNTTTPILNANEAAAGFDITGATSVADGQVVTVAIVDSNGNPVGSYTATASGGTWSVNVTPAQAQALADGSYTITANVSDPAGNPAPQASQTFTVAETLPKVTISATDGDGDNVITSTEAQGGVTLSGNVTGLAANSTFTITVTDGSFTKSYTATVDSAGTGWTATIPAADATTLPDGPAALTVKAQITDQFGNTSALATQTFTVAEVDQA